MKTSMCAGVAASLLTTACAPDPDPMHVDFPYGKRCYVGGGVTASGPPPRDETKSVQLPDGRLVKNVPLYGTVQQVIFALSAEAKPCVDPAERTKAPSSDYYEDEYHDTESGRWAVD